MTSQKSYRLLSSRPFAEAKHVAAHSNAVARFQRYTPGHRLIVDKRAPGRAGIFYIIPIAGQQNTGMQLFNAVIPEQADVTGLRSTNRRFLLGEDHFASGTPADLD